MGRRRWKTRKRPCAICRRWFQPDRRVGRRQRVCSSASCQRERHRRACADWHRRNPEYDREERLRRRLVHDETARSAVDPTSQVDWRVARDVVGVEVSVVIEESSKVIASWARDAVVAQPYEIQEESREVQAKRPRDAIAPRAPP